MDLAYQHAHNQRILKQRNLLVVVAAALAGLVVILFLMSASRDREIVLQPVLTSPLAVSSVGVSRQYLEMVTRDTAVLTLDRSPQNLEYWMKEVLAITSPKAQGKVKADLLKILDEQRGSSIAQFFTIQSMKIDPKNLVSEVTGDLHTIVGDKVISKELRTFRYNWEYSGLSLKLIGFGMGGIYVEVLKDVVFRLAPISVAEAREQIELIRSYPILRGVRGQAPADIDSILDTLLRASQLVIDFPEVVEMDINPLMVYDQGQGAIVLVPEIALTPQAIRRYGERFGATLTVLHSKLSTGELFDQWYRVQHGEARLVIGSRSAVFAPVQNLALIVLDEEHEWSYKQADPQPRYHARDVAEELCRLAAVIEVERALRLVGDGGHRVQGNREKAKDCGVLHDTTPKGSRSLRWRRFVPMLLQPAARRHSASP